MRNNQAAAQKANQLEKTKDLLYGVDGLGVTNFKLFPGSNRDVSNEEIAAQISAAIIDARDPKGGATVSVEAV